MQWAQNLLMVVQVLSAIGVIVLVLLQHGKGADMGAAFGSGASGSLFGATGSANFLSRSTSVLAALFFIATLGLALVVGHRPEAPASVMDAVPSGSSAPATPSGGGASAVPAAPADVPTAPAAPDAATQNSSPPADIPK